MRRSTQDKCLGQKSLGGWEKMVYCRQMKTKYWRWSFKIFSFVRKEGTRREGTRVLAPLNFSITMQSDLPPFSMPYIIAPQCTQPKGLCTILYSVINVTKFPQHKNTLFIFCLAGIQRQFSLARFPPYNLKWKPAEMTPNSCLSILPNSVLQCTSLQWQHIISLSLHVTLLFFPSG